jgi:SAM-dependent methyltransferase
MKESVLSFYDGLADEYHLMFADWRHSVHWQGEALDALIRRLAGPQASTVLDCACGIGTQAIGLARRGYQVTATDLSAAALARAIREAESFGLSLSGTVADFRVLEHAVDTRFDLVICLDNAISHLQEDADLVQATRSMRGRLNRGGLLLISIRDYDALLAPKPDRVEPGLPGVQVTQDAAGESRPSGTMPRVFPEPGGRRIAFQVWNWDAEGRSYAVEQFFVREAEGTFHVSHHVSRFRALRRAELTTALEAAGFEEIRWHMSEDSGFYQPVVSARSSAAE